MRGCGNQLRLLRQRGARMGFKQWKCVSSQSWRPAVCRLVLAGPQGLHDTDGQALAGCPHAAVTLGPPAL